MANYKESSKRAKETATFRFTTYEKRLLAHLAELQGMSQTALIRALLAERADQLEIDELPEPPPPRKPGRPKKNPSPREDEESTVEPDDSLELSERMFGSSHVSAGTLGALVVRFQSHFQTRGEKMQHELEGTVRFITGADGGDVLLALNLPLHEIDATLLNRVRERIKDASLRFPQKNLHLTYLRMMFNFAVKEALVPQAVQPMEVLRSFTAKEVADAFPLPIKTI
ncbi:MAG: hypothetical protein JXX29_11605 [Deltaproteobacteria bacterium]|nr:hypothetical protein [Deltaproteobacteria bacterium]MBN2672318.1 hypothetical protein [Deltaproteobacteria bacterium]